MAIVFYIARQKNPHRFRYGLFCYGRLIVPAISAAIPLIAGRMTLYAVLEVGNAFLDMFRADVARGVFVAAIAGV